MARRLRRLLAPIVMLGALCSGCSSSHGSDAASTSTLALPPAGNSTASLKATAVAWAHAFLVGSWDDMKALEGPECGTSSRATYPVQTVSQLLLRERADLAKHLGRPLDKIKITGVALRNVRSGTGDALVESDLPVKVIGHDNWVSYAIHAGRWKASDCNAPVGSSAYGSGGTDTGFCIMNACERP